MRSFFKRSKLIIGIIFILVLIPVLVFSVSRKADHYDIEPNSSLPNGIYPMTASGYATQAVCFNNTSSNKYFVSNKTMSEYVSFNNKMLASAVSGVSAKTNCCEDGVCVAGESCATCPSDCVCAPTCTSFTYSQWFACDANGNTQRVVTSASPAGCTGGIPDIAKPCCSGCPYGSQCTNQTWYGNGSCSGTSYNTINSSCLSTTDFPYLGWCYTFSSNSSLYSTSGSGCYYYCDLAPTSPAGCPSGSTCRAVTFYPNSSCSGQYSSEGAPYCIPDNVPASSCRQYLYSGTYSYITGAPNSGIGCTQASIIPNP